MKTFIILTLVALTTAEWNLKSREDFMKIQSDCYTRFEVPEDIQEKAIHDKFEPQAVQPIICLFRNLGFWNDSDGFSVDRIMIALESAKTYVKNYNEMLLRDGLVNCIDKNTQGSTPFNWAYRCFTCFADNKYLIKYMKQAKFHQL